MSGFPGFGKQSSKRERSEVVKPLLNGDLQSKEYLDDIYSGVNSESYKTKPK